MLSPTDHGRSVRPCLYQRSRHCGRRHPPRLLGRKVDAGLAADAELASPLLERHALLVHVLAELVEEDVARHRERLAQRERAVDGPAGVLELDATDRERARVVQNGVRGDVPALERSRGGDELEGGAGGIAGLDRAVEERLAERLRAERVEALLAERLREDVRVERRLRAERQHLAVVHVHDRERHPCRCRRPAPAGPPAGRRGRSTGAAGCPASAPGA